MQYTPFQLKEKLVQSLDTDNNVVDMRGVLEVVSLLETYPITRDALEQTRLGKFVNEMRRKTNNKELAKRAKNLVRQWKSLVETPSTPNTPALNGDGLALVGAGRARLLAGTDSRPASPASRPTTPAGRGLSPCLPVSRQIKAGLDPARRTASSPALNNNNTSDSRLSPGLPPHQTPTPLPGQGVEPFTTPLSSSTPIPGHGKVVDTPLNTTEKLSKTDASNRKRRRKNGVDNVVPAKRNLLGSASSSALCDKESGRQSPANGLLPASHSMSAITPHGSSSSLEGLNTRVSPEASEAKSKPLPATPSNMSNQKSFAAKRNSSLILNADAVRTPRQVVKTPKVKTTAELIEEMRTSGRIKVAGNNETVNKITANRIEKEIDNVDESVVPAGAKPRPRRKPGSSLTPLSASDASLQQTKSEMVQKFLQSSVAPSSSELDLRSPDKFARTDFPVDNEESMESTTWPDEDSQPAAEQQLNGASQVRTRPVKFFIGDELLPGSTPTPSPPAAPEKTEPTAAELALQQQAKDPWSCLPPLNLADIDWMADDYPEPVVPAATEEAVERLHSEQWAGVNGQYDTEQRWHDWLATYSMPTYNEDWLHILPYINLDL